MKILVLEDNAEKLNKITSYISGLAAKINVQTCVNFQQFLTLVERDQFDLIIADLLVPVFDDDLEAVDVAIRVVTAARDYECPNRTTPIVALTRFDYAAEENYKELNERGVSIATYDDSGSWEAIIAEKVISCMPNFSYEVVIICALKKEAKAFEEAGYVVGNLHSQHGMECREVTIDGKSCLIVTAPRMGLVGAAIATARAIDMFRPRLVCMGGICAGFAGEAHIYDVVITQICQQHDFGKWTAEGFEPEHYAVQLNHGLKLKIDEILDDPSFKLAVKDGVVLKASEFPPGKEELQFEIIAAPTSSGNAVIADEKMSKMIEGQHRKAVAFEMESFAVYEACRLAQSQPLFFSAKSVVDDGGAAKGDKFHRVAAILSAKTVGQIISRIL
jgi:nucleoside phosphorylase/CheY-like chemotaxis protein